MHFGCQELKYCLLSDLEDHDLKDLFDSFRCGNSSIERYLKQEAYCDHYEFSASTTLVFKDEEFVSYFTLVQGVLEINKDVKRNCLSIARLGVKTEHQSIGIGTSILRFIVALSEMFNQRYITIDSVWEYREFYYRRGFQPLKQDEYDNRNIKSLVYMFMDLYDEDKINELYNNP